jgi:hypothetical protein
MQRTSPATQLFAARTNLALNCTRKILVLTCLLVGSILISPSCACRLWLFEKDLGTEGF